MIKDISVQVSSLYLFFFVKISICINIRVLFISYYFKFTLDKIGISSSLFIFFSFFTVRSINIFGYIYC